jgi:hypothetical protein
MVDFFIEGGAPMFPILILGLLVVASATRYMLDGEPVRLRFVAVLSVALLVTVALATVLDVSMVLKHLARGELHGNALPPGATVKVLFQGLKESSRPAILGLGLLGLALDLLAIGAYRVGRRELRAAKG